MTVNLGLLTRNAMLDAIETTIGVSAVLRIRSGAKPANAAAARTGTILATVNLPADWMNAASNGSKTLLGSWSDVDGADATGTAGYFDITGGGNVEMQGTVTNTGGGGDMEVSNTNMVVGQPFEVTAFTINDNNG